MSFTDEFDICVQKAQEYLCFIEKIFSSGDEKFSDIINRNLQNSKKIFCKKSTLPLGYFDPCPVEDLIVGKSNRGKLSDKMLSSESLITYYFDNDILKMAEDRFNYKGDYYSSYSSNGTQYRIKEKRMYNEFYNI